MATYVTLLRFTQKGIENIKESPSRLDAARKAFSAAGAELKTFYLATGQYDAVAISEAPNDEAIVKAAITTASKGSIRTETFRVFTEDEYRKIIASLP